MVSVINSSSNWSIIAVGAEGNLRDTSGSRDVCVYQWSIDSWIQLGGDITRNVGRYYFGISVYLSNSDFILAIGAKNEDKDTPTLDMLVFMSIQMIRGLRKE